MITEKTNIVVSKGKDNKIALCFREYIFITLGAIAMSAGVYFFKIPNGFATGGASGIGTIL